MDHSYVMMVVEGFFLGLGFGCAQVVVGLIRR